jgi:hypothetical protein
VRDPAGTWQPEQRIGGRLGRLSQTSLHTYGATRMAIFGARWGSAARRSGRGAFGPPERITAPGDQPSYSDTPVAIDPLSGIATVLWSAEEGNHTVLRASTPTR